MRQLTISATAVLLSGLLACGDRKANETAGVSDTSLTVTTPDVDEAPVEARDFTFEERQEFAASIRQQLGELDNRIEELAAQAKSRGGAVSDRRLANVRSARRAVNRHLNRTDNATASDWEEIKTAVNSAVENVAEAVEMAQPK